MWSAPHHFYIRGELDTVQYPGIELDENENLVLLVLNSFETTRHHTTVQYRMINNLGQTFWEGSSIIAADPAQILSKTGFAIDNSSKIFLFVDTREALTIEAFEPGSNNTKSETYPERKATIVRKDVPRIGSTKQAHAAHASIARISSQNILVAWNQYNANFSHEQKNRNELVLQNTNSEHIQMQVLSRKLQEKTPEVQVDTLYAENTGSSSQTNNPPTSEPSRTERDSDMDGIDDLDEITLHKTDPQNPDSDGDGYLDGEEVANNYNPNGICRVKTFRNDGKLLPMDTVVWLISVMSSVVMVT